MPSVTREAAKFLAGYAGAETLGHWWMGVWGRHLMPLDLGWFTFTPAVNTFAMIFWPLVLVALVYHAWLRKTEPASAGAEAVRGGPVTV